MVFFRKGSSKKKTRNILSVQFHHSIYRQKGRYIHQILLIFNRYLRFSFYPNRIQCGFSLKYCFGMYCYNFSRKKITKMKSFCDRQCMNKHWIFSRKNLYKSYLCGNSMEVVQYAWTCFLDCFTICWICNKTCLHTNWKYFLGSFFRFQLKINKRTLTRTKME